MSQNIELPEFQAMPGTAQAEMESQALSDLWKKVCDILKVQMDPEIFELWLKPVKPHALTAPAGDAPRQFTAQVPNNYFGDWIRDNAAGQIALALRQVLGVETILDLQVAKDAEPLTPVAPMAAKDFKVAVAQEPVPPSLSIDQFNPKYVFETFIEGEANRFAKAAAEGVAREPGVRFNPLFIYGGVGLGKTHLMHALGQAICQNNPKARVLYISSEKFINEFINSLRFERPAEFRNKYRNLDCLLIDDIQFLMGKGRSEEEFFFTFNTLFDSRKQIVISSDRPPKEMGTLQDRLISRFEWGVVADVQPPDLETRIAILRKKAESERMFVPEDVILFIAAQVKSNIRELEGAFIRIVAFSSLTGTPLTVDSARATLKDILKQEEIEQPVTVELIQEVVGKHFNLDVRDMKSKKRTDAIAWPRQVAMYLARTLTELSTTEIGQAFGGKDHTTVLHACEKVKLKLAESPFISSLVNKITQEIKNQNTRSGN